ncbi:MAG: hypothetical protein K9H48_08595, partial [Melioribacteraceae bacterium]|nr:hypothetical protein [Melioribacteraceae bacterium]
MIDEIKNRISIEQLLSYLGIRPNRSNFIHSIYKQEKTASLKIYPATNTYFCFATDTGGDVIKFYADYHKIEVKQSIKELAEVFGIENNYNKNKQSDETINLVKYSINDQYKLLESEKELFDEKAAVSQFDKKLDRTTSEKLAFETILINRKIIQSKIYEAVYQFCKSKGIDE